MYPKVLTQLPFTHYVTNNHSLHNTTDVKVRVENVVFNNLSYYVYCSTGSMVITSTESFLPLKKKRLLEHTIGSKVSALAGLTLGENLFNSQEKSVRCLHQWVSILSGLNLEKI